MDTCRYDADISVFETILLVQTSLSIKAAIDKDARPTSEFDMDMPGRNLSPFITNDLFPSSMLNDMNSGSRVH